MRSRCGARAAEVMYGTVRVMCGTVRSDVWYGVVWYGFMRVLRKCAGSTLKLKKLKFWISRKTVFFCFKEKLIKSLENFIQSS